ncbi:zinc metalloprotease [Oceanicola sp. 22II-s10i]|uniref:RIP metalloprotease RseP n=1 Tax=Oceanicola sp. 22II-s10i TaxID=1317116 RepID=UPI000B5244E8|nr:RIP metalloprotease RseP [Oceanicola sp. 22II-s10i]OWU83578.1 zinc metalloprotease [Oceanicola sp. 22II-s10i]
MAFLPEFGGVVMTLVAFVVALSIIVAIHEYGHYIVGRWSGIHAEVFSLGFGPVLFSRTDRHGTQWQLAALPFGGYVRFMGDLNAASGKDGEAMGRMSEADHRRTMHGAPLWARTATVAAGPVFNFVLSIIVFTALFMLRGQVAEPLTVGEMRQLPDAGYELQAGDEVLAVAGVQVPAFSDGTAMEAFGDALPATAPLDYAVRRDGQEITVTGPNLYPPIISQLAPQSAAYDIGLKAGDVITSIEGERISAFEQLKSYVEGAEGAPIQITVYRPGEEAELDFVLAPRRVDEPQPEGGFETRWRIGIVGGLAFEPATETVGPVEALADGLGQTWRIVTSSISGLWHMATGAISTCNMTGPIGIAQTSGAMASQGAESFVWFVAALSTAVGLLNLFPVPVLDGGHLVFYAFEAATGRPPSDRALRVLMAAGLTLVLSLMVFALTNDLFCP